MQAFLKWLVKFLQKFIHEEKPTVSETVTEQPTEEKTAPEILLALEEYIKSCPIDKLSFKNDKKNNSRSISLDDDFSIHLTTGSTGIEYLFRKVLNPQGVTTSYNFKLTPAIETLMDEIFKDMGKRVTEKTKELLKVKPDQPQLSDLVTPNLPEVQLNENNIPIIVPVDSP